MIGRARRRVGAALLVAILSSPGLALAQDATAESDGHIQRGVELRRAGKNSEALAEFRLAYALVPAAPARAQIGLALQALGEWVEAERALGEALRSTDAPWIGRYREVLEGALDTVRSHLARVYVDVNVPSAELFVDGAGGHALPLADGVRVAAGTVALEVRAAGFVPVGRVLTLAPGAEVHELFTLEPTVPAVSPAIPSDTGAVAPAPAPRHTVAAVVAFGASAALVAGGVVAWRVREDDVMHYNDDTRCLVGTLTRDQQCGSVATASNVALGLEIGAFVVAGAAAGVGAWLLWAPAKRATVAMPSCGPAGPLGVVCTGSF